MSRIVHCLIAISISVGCGGPKVGAEIGGFVRENGYADPKPASNLLEPGTVVYRKETTPLVYGIACTARSAFGDGIGSAVKNADAANASIISKMQRKFKLDAEYQKQIQASVGAGYLKDITLDLSDVHVLSLPANEVFDRVNSRTPGCTKAIEFFAQRAQPVSVVTEVLKANVLYTIAFNESVAANVGAQLQAVQGLAAQLGADASTATQGTIKGTGLFWGLRDDASLATVAPDKPGFRGGPSIRLIPSESVAIDLTPAANVTHAESD